MKCYFEVIQNQNIVLLLEDKIELVTVISWNFLASSNIYKCETTNNSLSKFKMHTQNFAIKILTNIANILNNCVEIISVTETAITF